MDSLALLRHSSYPRMDKVLLSKFLGSWCYGWVFPGFWVYFCLGQLMRLSYWATISCFCITSCPNKVKCLWGNNPPILISFSMPFLLKLIGGSYFLFKSPTWLKAHCQNLPVCSKYSSRDLHIWLLPSQIISLSLVYRVTLLTYLSIHCKKKYWFGALYLLCSEILCLSPTHNI